MKTTRILVSILEDKRIGNCSNDGISAKHSQVMLIRGDAWAAMSAEEQSQLKEEMHGAGLPLVKTVSRNIGGVYVHAEPVVRPDPKHNGWMHGGAYLKTSDSRYEDVTGVRYPISLHDRQEEAS